MVIKKTIITHTDYITKRAKEVKVIPHHIRFSKTRKCKQLNQQKNCKIKVEKKLTKSQEEIYNEILSPKKEKKKIAVIKK